MMKRILALFAALLVLCLTLFSCAKAESGDAYPGISYNKAADYNADELMNGMWKSSSEVPEENSEQSGAEQPKIIRTFSLDSETKEYEEAVAKVKNAVNACGGYVENSKLSGGESYGNYRRTSRHAEFTLRIPSEKVDSFVSDMEGLLNVTSSSENTSDVTEEYYDMKARMDTLITKRDALSAMLSQAKDLTEYLTVNDELYRVIADIEAYQTRLNRLDSRVDYSVVSLSINEVIEFTEAEQPGFGERIGRAFKDSWKDFFEGCKDFAVWFVEAIPTLLVLAVIVTVIVLIVVGIVKKSRKK